MFWPDGCVGVRDIDKKSPTFWTTCIDEFLVSHIFVYLEILCKYVDLSSLLMVYLFSVLALLHVGFKYCH